MNEEFNLWWGTPYTPVNNPYTPETPAWWSWEAWHAATKVEREACAKMIDELDKQRWKEYSEHHTDYGDNIRARNNT